MAVANRDLLMFGSVCLFVFDPSRPPNQQNEWCVPHDVARRGAFVQKSGGPGHLSGVIHALLLLAILLVLGSLAEQIPMAVLAGILITVGLGIVDLKGLKHVIRAPRGDAAVMIIVLALTVFVDLMTAVAVGMVMAAMSIQAGWIQGSGKSHAICIATGH